MQISYIKQDLMVFRAVVGISIKFVVELSINLCVLLPDVCPVPSKIRDFRHCRRLCRICSHRVVRNPETADVDRLHPVRNDILHPEGPLLIPAVIHNEAIFRVGARRQ